MSGEKEKCIHWFNQAYDWCSICNGDRDDLQCCEMGEIGDIPYYCERLKRCCPFAHKDGRCKREQCYKDEVPKVEVHYD